MKAPLLDENGRKECTKCGRLLTKSRYRIGKSLPSGYRAQCRDCENKRRSDVVSLKNNGLHIDGRRLRRRVPNEHGYVECAICKQLKYKTEFSPQSNTASRLDHRCRTCNAKRATKYYTDSKTAFLHSLAYAHRHAGGSERRKSLARDSIVTQKMLMDLWERQGGRCAITGIKFTHKRGNGMCNTNVSIDRIDSLLGYTEENTQLVCYAVNMIKSNYTDAQLSFWCKAILNGLQG